MSVKNHFVDQDPIVWVRQGRGGPGYGERPLGRVVRMNDDGRVTVMVFRPMDRSWVIRSVGRDELARPAADERRRLEELELEAAPAARMAA